MYSKRISKLFTVFFILLLVLNISSCSLGVTEKQDNDNNDGMEELILDPNLNYYGELDIEKTNSNFENQPDLYVLFGSALRQYGANLSLNNDGTVEYSIGVVYATGTWRQNDNILDFDLIDRTEGEVAKKFSVVLSKEDGQLYLLMSTSMGDELDDNGEFMYWKLYSK